MDTDSLRGSVGVKSVAAKHLAPTIASVPPPSTEELVEKHVSRKLMYESQI